MVLTTTKNQALMDVYASRTSGKVLTGMLGAVEPVKLITKEKVETIECGVVFYNGIKVIIPIHEMNISREDRRVIRSMIGSEIDFIVFQINTSSNPILVAASRTMAMEVRRNKELVKYKAGDKIKVRVTAIGKEDIIVEAYGLETKIPKAEVNWGYIADLSDHVRIGDKVQALIKEINIESTEEKEVATSRDIDNKPIDFKVSNSKLVLSIRETLPDPFKIAIHEYKVGGEYLSTVTGIKDFGVFVELRQGISALCPHTSWVGYTPVIGEKVLILITKIDASERKISAVFKRSICKP